MEWLKRQRLRHFVASSIWLQPVAAIVVGFLLFRILWAFDLSARWNPLEFTPDGARSLLGTFASAMLTFVVVGASILLIAVQLVSTTLSPRIIAVV